MDVILPPFCPRGDDLSETLYCLGARSAVGEDTIRRLTNSQTDKQPTGTSVQTIPTLTCVYRSTHWSINTYLPLDTLIHQLLPLNTLIHKLLPLNTLVHQFLPLNSLIINSYRLTHWSINSYRLTLRSITLYILIKCYIYPSTLTA